MKRRNGVEHASYDKLIKILDREQEKRGLSQSAFGKFLGHSPSTNKGYTQWGSTLANWRVGRSGPSFWMVIEMWDRLGRSLSKDFQ